MVVNNIEVESLSQRVKKISAGNTGVRTLILDTLVDLRGDLAGWSDDDCIRRIKDTLAEKIGEPIPEPLPDGFWDERRVDLIKQNSKMPQVRVTGD